MHKASYRQSRKRLICKLRYLVELKKKKRRLNKSPYFVRIAGPPLLLLIIRVDTAFKR